MWQSGPAGSTFSSGDVAMVFRAIGASWWAKAREHFGHRGALGYVLIWVVYPCFQMATAGLIYRGHRPALVSYAVVGTAAGAFLFNMLYGIGQILDEERWGGTLTGLFLAPAPRISWLTGFALGGLLETSMAAITTVLFGALAFGVRFHADLPALALSFVLFLLSLWGIGFVFSAIGLVIKRSNDVSNLVFPFVTLLGGVYYPVSLLPLWLRFPARCLPFGYGMQAMAGAALHGAGIAQLLPQLLPLAGFALVLPVAGIWAFGWLERGVRERGQLELF